MSDITYCTVNGVELKMDIYSPQDTTAVQKPLVVYVHGGAWVGGDKRSGAGSLDISGFCREDIS
jgi:acetyl esterase/lipase